MIGHFAAAGKWASVAEPAGWAWPLPFAIEQKRRQFRAPASFDLRAHAGISVTVSYYVDAATGNNNNDGLTLGTALADVVTAKNKPDVDRIYIAANNYFHKNRGFYAGWPARSIEVIGLGPNITLSSDFSNIITGWTLVDSHYEASLSAEYVQRVYDSSNLDGLGYPTELTQVGSIGACDATPGSFYRDFPTAIYVHAFDGRAPDANLRFYEAEAISCARDNVTGYLENLTINLYPGVSNASAAGGNKFYLKNCILNGGFYATGVDEIILQNCTLRRHELNYHAGNGRPCKVIEINVDSSYNMGDATTQASTLHDDSIAVSIGGQYHHSSGQNVADAGAGSMRWMLGSRVFSSSTSGVGIYTEGTTWLDSCQSYNNATPIEVPASGTVHTRNFHGPGTNIVDGTLDTY